MPRVIVCDVNETLLDVGALEPQFNRAFGDGRILQEWFGMVLLYSEVATLAGPYSDFASIGGAALDMAAAARGVTLASTDRGRILHAMLTLPAHPDVREGLQVMRDAGLRLVTLTNSAPAAVQQQLAHAGLAAFFERSFSVDSIRRFKPAPEAYRTVADGLALPADRLRLVAAHAWDVVGALRAGCAAAFVERPGKVLYPLGPKPDIVASLSQRRAANRCGRIRQMTAGARRPAATTRDKRVDLYTRPLSRTRHDRPTVYQTMPPVVRSRGAQDAGDETSLAIVKTIAAAALLVMMTAVASGQLPGGAELPAGPPAPTLPQTIERDGQGRATVRAARVSTPMHIDGRLDEAIYSTVQPASDFIQMEPSGGQAATEKTEVWVFFDKDNVYVSFRAWESQPSRMIVNEMRRDSNNIRQGDSVEFAFDTFRDRRNAILFEANALGARTDLQSTNERQFSADWNPVWNLAAGRFDGGWTIEAAIPFKSIRYAPGTAQDWGFQARRSNKWKNEIAYLTRVPPALGLGRADFSASLYANLVGIEAPPLSRTLELKPYAIADLTTDNASTPKRAHDPDGDVGVDAKYSITQNLTADLTVNTDFAQVEADEQQVNLTRFSLFFPEKRDFFLENQGLFTFGNNSFAGAAAATTSDLPILFYSRRIGLVNNREVPILAGGRVTGRVGRYSLGLVNMQTRDDAAASAPATNFSVVRVKRDILRRSSVGVLATSRSKSQTVTGSNQVIGVDGTFGFFNNLTLAAYLAKSRSDTVTRDDFSYRAQMEYGGDRYGVQVERLSIDPNFNPEVGFLRRTDLRKNFALLRFSPRPKASKRVRKFSSIGQFTYVEDSAGRLSTRISDGEFAVELQNSDRFAVGINDDYELLLRPFTIVPGARVPIGGYRFTTGRIGYNMGQQRRVSGNVLFERGSFYDGNRTALTFNRSRLNVSPQLSVEPSLSVNWIDLPAGSFTTTLAGSRITFTVTPLLFASALVQYNSSTHTVSANARLRWEYRPGSELFVVYNEERDSEAAAGLPGLQNRAFIVKVNRFLRF